ncbi:MAG: phycobiliprotein lyase [Phormidesmis sp. RL_2_1]|nr:phycobiliprotein lyase [Phormidesmis sp. RL_2_1]
MTELRPDRDFIEIVNFFEKLAGRWFSQRTTHALSTQQSKAGKSDLEVTFLAPDTDAVQQLWQTHLAVQPNATPLCGLQIQQSSTIEGDSQPQVLTTTLLVPLTPHLQAGESYTGALLRSGADYPSTYTLAAEC